MKLIVTPKRSLLIIIFIYITFFLAVFPAVYTGTHSIGWKTYPERNRTLLGLVLRSYYKEVEDTTNAINACLQISSFLTLILCTAGLVVELSRKNQWRKTISFTGGQNLLSKRDQRLCKMIVVMSTILIVCFIPSTCSFVANIAVPGYGVSGRYEHVFSAVWSVTWVFEATGSSVNMFLYYVMSSKYRHTFRQVLCRKEKTAVGSGQLRISPVSRVRYGVMAKP